jgi:hypothetical protein
MFRPRVRSFLTEILRAEFTEVSQHGHEMSGVFGWVLMALMDASNGLAQSAGFAYVTNCEGACGGNGPGTVAAYRIDGTTGALTPVP